MNISRLNHAMSYFIFSNARASLLDENNRNENIKIIQIWPLHNPNTLIRILKPTSQSIRIVSFY